MKPLVLVLSCEHAVNTVPVIYQSLFSHHLSLLHSPFAYDLGALDIAVSLRNRLHCRLVQSTVTRLLIDCDHSALHAECFSKFSKKFSAHEKEYIIQEYYTPFYQALDQAIAEPILKQKQVLHLSIHTFAPKLRGLIHQAGIGLSYDSNRHGEKEVARIIHGLILQEPIPYKIRMNYPFSGSKDYVLNHYRKQHEQRDYLGIKIEVNQALLSNSTELDNLCNTLANSLNELLLLL